MGNQITTTTNQRLSIIEKDLSELKRAFFNFLAPLKNRFKSDSQAWKAMKKDYEAIQEKLFQEKYPDLYAKIKR